MEKMMSQTLPDFQAADQCWEAYESIVSAAIRAADAAAIHNELDDRQRALALKRAGEHLINEAIKDAKEANRS
jgi:hypothetical protein